MTVWVDTPFASTSLASAELSETIDLMYRWYGNVKVYYKRFHGVHGLLYFCVGDDDASQFQWLAGVVLTWVASIGTQSVNNSGVRKSCSSRFQGPLESISYIKVISRRHIRNRRWGNLRKQVHPQCVPILQLTEGTLTLTRASHPCSRTYSETRGNGRFGVAFGQCSRRNFFVVKG